MKYYARQILLGLDYIHSRGVLHRYAAKGSNSELDIRDLKLGNMLLTENMTVKIADFGLACMIEGARDFLNNCVDLVLDNMLLIVTFPSENKSGSICGTPNYIAPEVLHKRGHSTASEVFLSLLALNISSNCKRLLS